MLRVLKCSYNVSCCQLFDHPEQMHVPLLHIPLRSFLRLQCHWHTTLATAPMAILGIVFRGSSKSSAIKYCFKEYAELPLLKVNVLKTT